jgi:hypothetical protein
VAKVQKPLRNTYQSFHVLLLLVVEGVIPQGEVAGAYSAMVASAVDGCTAIENSLAFVRLNV